MRRSKPPGSQRPHLTPHRRRGPGTQKPAPKATRFGLHAKSPTPNARCNGQGTQGQLPRRQRPSAKSPFAHGPVAKNPGAKAPAPRATGAPRPGPGPGTKTPVSRSRPSGPGDQDPHHGTGARALRPAPDAKGLPPRA